MFSIIVAHYKNINDDYSKIKEQAKTITNSLNDFIVCHTSIFMLYNGKIYNPPYYSNILIMDDKQEYIEEKLRMALNMLLIDGIIVVPKKYANVFYKIGTTHLQKVNQQVNANYVAFIRKTNIVLKSGKWIS